MPILGTATVTVTTSSTTNTANMTLMPRAIVAVLLRTPTTNTDNVYVGLSGKTATSGDIIVRPGESIAIDFSDHLQLKTMLGQKLEDTDFIQFISTISATASQTLWVDTFSI